MSRPGLVSFCVCACLVKGGREAGTAGEEWNDLGSENGAHLCHTGLGQSVVHDDESYCEGKERDTLWA